MNFDGSKMRGGLGADIVLVYPKGDKLQYALQIHFAALNNVAEYEDLVHGLKLAKEIGIWRILYFGDSTSWYIKSRENGMPRTLTWPPTASMSSSSMDSSRATSSIMFPKQTMMKQTGYPRSAPLGKPSQLGYRWR
jgi:hypothetical protein